MKKSLLLVSIATLVLVAGGLFLWQKGQARETTVVAFGDSLVEGVGSAQGGGFVPVLSEKIGVPIQNFGIRGNTTSEALARISDVVKQKPDIVILLLGGNDYLRGVPREQTAANFGIIINTLQAAGAKVLLVGLSSPLYPTEDRAFFAGLAATYHTSYVPDVLGGISDKPSLLSSDQLHPNDAGYALMAERIYPALKTLLRTRLF